MAEDSVIYRSDHVLEYPYVRSVGPVVGAFLTGLRDGKVVGTRGTGGRVIVPPTEYDPETGEETDGVVEVGPEGTVTTWSWVARPRPKHPLQEPFAWVLVQFDGADTSFLHVLPAAEPRRGLDRHAGAPRVRSRGRAGRTRQGHQPLRGGRRCGVSEREPVTMMAATTHLDYVFTAGVAMSKNLHGYEQGKFIGQRCPKCKKVYIPSRGSCPTDGLPTDEIVELPNTGTVTTYCVVNVPFAGQSIEIPYICGQILLDGANLSFMGLIQEIPTDEIRMGMRVEAVWVARPRSWGRRWPRSSTSAPPASPTPTTRPTRSTCERVPRARLGPPAGRRGVLRPVRQRAARGRAQRGRDAHAGRGRGVRQHRHHQGRRRLHLLGLDRLPRSAARSPSSRRSTPSGCGRPGPSRTSRWTAPGRSTRPGCCCRRARSTPPSSTPSDARRWATSPRSCPSSSTRTTWRRCGRTRRRWPRCRRRP